MRGLRGVTARVTLCAAVALFVVACGDDAPSDSGSDGGATSVPGNEPADADGGGMNEQPDTGGEDLPGEDTTGGPTPDGGTTGQPQ